LRRKLGMRTKEGGSMLFWLYIALANELKARGRLEDAHWVLDFGHSQLPEYFTMEYRNPYKDRPEAHAPRKPTNNERKRGLSLDVDGFVQLDEKGQRYRQAEYEASRGLQSTG